MAFTYQRFYEKLICFTTHRKPLIVLLAFGLYYSSVSALAQSLPINPKATTETKNLFANLQRLAGKGVLFGHHDDLAYGIGWKDQPGRSDVQAVAGEYPAVFGWEIGKLEFNHSISIDSVPFAKMRAYIQQVYAQGGVNTISWHLNNPVQPAKTSWDKADSTVIKLFADNKALKRYEGWLDHVADFMKSLKSAEGEAIPIIFRPYHEHTGSWFWWGRGHVAPPYYVKLWRFTVDYLRKKKVNNLLYAYSTDRFTSREDYLQNWPGDDYVDIIGFDLYHRPESDPYNTFVADARRMVETVRQIGQEKRKVWAFTETGQERVPFANWWTGFLLPIIQDAGLSYVMVWRNARLNHFYAPYPEHVSARNFKLFATNPKVLLQTKTAAENLYAPVPAH
ncbi:glycoside hydrolase family 26 protein [Adhaeribacter pallidiroseus]|uniref:Mannan endo-1,4-beta-mannosidase n=1 Tax=Adhaeribacter pallidiroseus TaxID=2072847 RepID=A0A369QEY7_9BACT|nr:glycosyl hydrolase [Adhaeribacter pallidiroseus]RDC61469.1 Mannan endo-1,4-beta-mannosidase [Adhaeribacter pallidiroseus]